MEYRRTWTVQKVQDEIGSNASCKSVHYYMVSPPKKGLAKAGAAVIIRQCHFEYKEKLRSQPLY